MIRGGGCAIRPAPTQKWAAATYLAIGTTKKELRRDTGPKIEATNHKYTLRYHRGVLSYIPRVINRWFVRDAQNYHRGVVSCVGGDFLCTGDIHICVSCDIPLTPVLSPVQLRLLTRTLDLFLEASTRGGLLLFRCWTKLGPILIFILYHSAQVRWY